MEKNNAIDEGYMTVGEAAKKMGTTVRTLQYYDRIGLLSPSSKSEGGRRLYTYRDLIALHQILTLKHLGFSLDDIKNRLLSLNTPDEVLIALSEQADAIREKISALKNSLMDIEALEKEVKQMRVVDFKKYADIIANLQMKNEYYWLIKHFDEETLDHIRVRFNKKSGIDFINDFNRLCDRIIKLKNQGLSAESKEVQAAAEQYWGMVMDFTAGDMSLLPKLMEMGKLCEAENEWGKRQAEINSFIEPALSIYFSRRGTNPFEEMSE